MSETIKHPFYPIIYVRGFAGTMGQIDDTVSTPFMGFNLGSTKIRQLWNKKLEKIIFESPLIRLMKDLDYKDVYDGGDPLVDHIRPVGSVTSKQKIPSRSVVIFRYYDEASEAFGKGKDIAITKYASMLNQLIENLRDEVTGGDPVELDKFKVYLVAHSMGGLICRCFLQNTRVGDPATKKLVDKVFTYATPHNGIDVRLLGNVPKLWFKDNADTFNRSVLRKEILKLGQKNGNSGDRVDYLDGHFPPDRFFCLVGTDSKDYGAAAGLSRVAVGPHSDGLVRITNATVQGSPRAFVHRSHSGDYGIVNSESGYQNLTRFLFGNVRIDGSLVMDSLSLPKQIQKKKDQGKDIKASYHFECVVRTRGARWDMHRRVVSETSSIHRTYEELFEAPVVRSPYLFSQFLSAGSWAKAKQARRSLGFQIDLRVLVPEYTIDNQLWLDDHYDGGYIYNERIAIEVTPASKKSGQGAPPLVRYGVESRNGPGLATKTAVIKLLRADGNHGIPSYEIAIPVVRNSKPGIAAQLILKVTPWNMPPG